MLNVKSLIYIILFSFFVLTLQAQDTTQNVILNRYNSIEQQQKPYVILISIDGFRWDLADKYQAKNLIKLRESGVQADYLKPSYPSLTFPNHYSIVTGLYPSHHGVVNNIFYDKTTDVLFKRSDKKMAVDDYSNLEILGMKHIAFEVDDIEKKIVELKVLGVETTDPKQGASGGKYVFLKDPDGIPIELYEEH